MNTAICPRRVRVVWTILRRRTAGRGSSRLHLFCAMLGVGAGVPHAGKIGRRLNAGHARELVHDFRPGGPSHPYSRTARGNCQASPLSVSLPHSPRLRAPRDLPGAASAASPNEPAPRLRAFGAVPPGLIRSGSWRRRSEFGDDGSDGGRLARPGWFPLRAPAPVRLLGDTTPELRTPARTAARPPRASTDSAAAGGARSRPRCTP